MPCRVSRFKSAERSQTLDLRGRTLAGCLKGRRTPRVNHAVKSALTPDGSPGPESLARLYPIQVSHGGGLSLRPNRPRAGQECSLPGERRLLPESSCSTPPKERSAAARASFSFKPDRRCCSVRRSRWSCTSSASSSSDRPLSNRSRMREVKIRNQSILVLSRR